MSTERPRKTPWVLVASFALNGLLVGILAMALFMGTPNKRGGPHGPPAGPTSGPDSVDRGMARAVIQSAPASERAEIRRALGDAWRRTARDRRVIREAQRTIMQAIEADTFDRDALSAAFQTWREADQRIKTIVQGALMDALDRLPAENRKALSEEMKRREARRGPRGERPRDRLRDRPPPPRD